jgi:hypothetical protein
MHWIFTKNRHEILGITGTKNESIWKYFHARKKIEKL